MTYPTDYADPHEAYPIDLDPSDLLKPCPFCGALYSETKFTPGTVQMMQGNISFWVLCLNCGIRTGEHHNAESAAEIWNRRANDGE